MNEKWSSNNMPRHLEGLAYKGPRFRDFTFNESLPPPRTLRRNKKSRAPIEDLGVLELLPLELLQMSVRQLDIQTLDDFRCVNRRAMQVVDSIPSYKAIATQMPSVLRGILSIEVGRWITCGQLLDELCTAECRSCGEFGGYLYLLGGCERVCFLCFSKKECYLPLSRREAMRKFGLTQRIVDGLPSMKNIPGFYSLGKEVRARRRLVDAESARHAGIVLHGSIAAMKRFVSRVAAKKMREYEERKKTVARARRPRTEDPIESCGTPNPMRFMAVFRAPWLDRSSQKLEWGFHCWGCRSNTHFKERTFHCSRKFTVASLSEHLNKCRGIRNNGGRLELIEEY